MKRLYDPDTLHAYVKEIDTTLQVCGRLLKRHGQFDLLTDLSEDELNEIIYRTEKSALSCRAALETRHREGVYTRSGNAHSGSDTGGVRVEFDGRTLRVHTPFTFKRFYRDSSMKENYILMNYVRAALIKWQEENGTDLFQALKPPLTVMIIRKGPAYDRQKICDNDNLENGRIVNEIMEALGCSDNAMVLDLYSCFRITEDAEDFGMEFVVCPRSDVGEYLTDTKA